MDGVAPSASGRPDDAGEAPAAQPLGAIPAAPLGRLPDPLPIDRAAGPLLACIRLPGSKSITNRLLVLAALGEGPSTLRGALRSDDTDRLAAALSTLGAGVSIRGTTIEVQGVGGWFPRGGRIDLGDGGTPTRFMLAAACRAVEPVIVDGSPRMRERPIAEGVELLRTLGASIEYVEEEGRLPVRVDGRAREGMRGGRIRVGATASSQFISALMLLAPLLPEGLEIEYTTVPTSASYLALTRAALRDFGVEVRDAGLLGPRRDRIAPARLVGRALEVEPDASSAVYWMVAAALVPGSRVTVEGLASGSPQPDIGMLEVLERAGARWTSRRSPREVTVEGPAVLRGVSMSLAHMPDGAMAAAMLAARADGASELGGLHTLRVKESDRLAALANELGRVGCQAEVRDDALRIRPERAGSRVPEAVIDTYRDHRVAMAFAVLGLARGGISIRDPGCVAKSYPGFWRDLFQVVG